MAGGDPYDGSPRFTGTPFTGGPRGSSRELRGHHVDVLVKVAERALRPPRNRAQRGVRQHERDVVLRQTGRGVLVERLRERAQHARRGGQQRVRVARRARFRNDETRLDVSGNVSGNVLVVVALRLRFGVDGARVRAPAGAPASAPSFPPKSPSPTLASRHPASAHASIAWRAEASTPRHSPTPRGRRRRQSLVGVCRQRALVQGVEGGLQQARDARPASAGGYRHACACASREDSTISTRASTAEASARSSSATRETPFIFSSVSAAKTPPPDSRASSDNALAAKRETSSMTEPTEGASENTSASDSSTTPTEGSPTEGSPTEGSPEPRALEISASRAAYSVSVTAASCLRANATRARGGWVRRVAERRAGDRRVGGAAPARPPPGAAGHARGRARDGLLVRVP